MMTTKEDKMKEKVAKEKRETKSNIKNLKSAINDAAKIEKEIKKLEAKLKPFNEMKEELQETELKKIEIVRRKGSTLLLTNWNTGLVISNPHNTYNEKKVNRYDNGKKGKLIEDRDRESVYFWKNYLLEESY